MVQDEEEIRQLQQTWLRAAEQGDVDLVASLMADDVVFLRAGQPPIHGRAEFMKLQKEIASMRMEAKSEVREISVYGGRAHCWSFLSVTMTTPEGKTMRRAGDVLTLFRKESDGRWVVYRDANLLA